MDKNLAENLIEIFSTDFKKFDFDLRFSPKEKLVERADDALNKFLFGVDNSQIPEFLKQIIIPYIHAEVITEDYLRKKANDFPEFEDVLSSLKKNDSEVIDVKKMKFVEIIRTLVRNVQEIEKAPNGMFNKVKYSVMAVLNEKKQTILDGIYEKDVSLDGFKEIINKNADELTQRDSLDFLFLTKASDSLIRFIMDLHADKEKTFEGSNCYWEKIVELYRYIIKKDACVKPFVKVETDNANVKKMYEVLYDCGCSLTQFAQLYRENAGLISSMDFTHIDKYFEQFPHLNSERIKFLATSFMRDKKFDDYDKCLSYNYQYGIHELLRLNKRLIIYLALQTTIEDFE